MEDVDRTAGDPTGASARADEPKWRRRRRLDAVFGDDLPATTTDERATGDASVGRSREWYDLNRPPHHG